MDRNEDEVAIDDSDDSWSENFTNGDATDLAIVLGAFGNDKVNAVAVMAFDRLRSRFGL